MKLLLALTLVVVLGGSQALQCFSCVDCGKKIGRSAKCSADQNVCMKAESGKTIARTCGKKELCGMGKIGRASKAAWTKIASLFKNVKDEPKIYCCKDDYCNGGTKSLPSLYVALLPLTLLTLFK